jgi:hypothetical protein
LASIQSSFSFPTFEELTSNITAAYRINGPSSDHVIGLVCMIDEIKVEEMLDWCPHTNSVIGLCRKHSRANACTFSNIDDAHVMFDDLANKRVHFGTEVRLTLRNLILILIGIAGNSRCNRSTHQKPSQIYSMPFPISATCKSENAAVHGELLSLAWKACDQMKGVTKGKVYCLASDGESRRGKALVALMECTPLSPTSPLFTHLGGLALLNLMVGEDELTSDKDYKHVMK